MKYRKKSEIIEAVKWDGKIETIEKNKWLEDAIKEDKVVLGMNDIHDKEPILLEINGNNLRVIEVGRYVIKESRDDRYIIYGVEAEDFEEMYEVIQEENKTLNNCFAVELELDTGSFNKSLNEAKEDLNNILKLVDKIKDTDSFKVITKDEFIANHVGKISKEKIDESWKRLSKGYNFVLYKETNQFYSVDKLNELFRR